MQRRQDADAIVCRDAEFSGQVAAGKQADGVAQLARFGAQRLEQVARDEPACQGRQRDGQQAGADEDVPVEKVLRVVFLQDEGGALVRQHEIFVGGGDEGGQQWTAFLVHLDDG